MFVKKYCSNIPISHFIKQQSVVYILYLTFKIKKNIYFIYLLFFQRHTCKMGKSQSKPQYKEMKPLSDIPPAYEDILPLNEKVQIEFLIHLSVISAKPGMCATNHEGMEIIGMLKQLLEADCQIRKPNLTKEAWKHCGNLLVFLMKRSVSSHLVNKLRNWLKIEADEMVFAIHQSFASQKKTPKKLTVWSTKFWLGEEKA